MYLYFAGPLFSAAERDFDERLTARIETLGYEVFLPQRDSADAEHVKYGAMLPEERGPAIFDIDKTNVLKCDVLLFVLDGRIPDEGACVELGIAYAQKELQRPEKRLIGLLTDQRAAFPQWKLNPMVGEALDQVAETE